ncbi:hypothetical protein J8L88_10015 [Aquimarina sp. MMG015]|uniref:hypothetical protein n=1 Tax=unclassified Aquimarina TaxID=2627091 RepID=UPI000D54EC46|nr:MULTISPECIES: hypothetical protein [unclassified Aquimarina]AXT57874.1 hypothetical protein D1815_19720 [Aquimarina sp. AD1]MBQ4803182.1 hypothetical protein [Aquimarina sp. MMG015]RKN28049.1 hypothetical protein D7035_08720 [Aquimarina sp. AD1]
MKKTTILLLLVLTIGTLSAQTKKKGVLYNDDKLINRFHTIDELQDLNKGALIELYLERTREIFIVLPYLSLSNQPGTSLSDIGIKEDSDNIKVVEKNNEIADRAFVYTTNTVKELVPYSDTDNIIWAILYFEEMIKKMRLGKDGNI